MTVTRRQLVLAAALGVLMVVMALADRWRGGRHHPEELVTPENPLVIDAPRTLVVVGSDTATVFGPTLFAVVGAPGVDEGVEPTVPEGAVALQNVLGEAGPGLRAVGVKIVTVDVNPIPLDVPAEMDAAAGPALTAAAVGMLLIDGRGRMRRLDRVVDSRSLTCLAVSTFELRLPPEMTGLCR